MPAMTLEYELLTGAVIDFGLSANSASVGIMDNNSVITLAAIAEGKHRGNRLSNLPIYIVGFAAKLKAIRKTLKDCSFSRSKSTILFWVNVFVRWPDSLHNG